MHFWKNLDLPQCNYGQAARKHPALSDLPNCRFRVLQGTGKIPAQWHCQRRRGMLLFRPPSMPLRKAASQKTATEQNTEFQMLRRLHTHV